MVSQSRISCFVSLTQTLLLVLASDYSYGGYIYKYVKHDQDIFVLLYFFIYIYFILVTNESESVILVYYTIQPTQVVYNGQVNEAPRKKQQFKQQAYEKDGW